MKAIPILQVVVLVICIVSIGMALVGAFVGAWPQAIHATFNAVGAGVIYYFGNRLLKRNQ